MWSQFSIPTPVYFVSLELITPRTCTRGKVIGFVRLSACHHKIARSGHLGIWVTSKYNKSIQVIENLSSLCFKFFGKAHKHRKHCVFIGDTYQLYPSTTGHVHTSATYTHYCCSSHFCANRCECRCNVWRDMCSVELKLFCSALGMGKIITVFCFFLFFCMCGIGLKLQICQTFISWWARLFLPLIWKASSWYYHTKSLSHNIRPCQQIWL